MPIVIDEVVIAIEVTASCAPCPHVAEPRKPGCECEALIDECVQKVLEILRREQDAGY